MGVGKHVVAGLALPELVGGVLRLLRRRGAGGHEEGARGGEGQEGTHLRVSLQLLPRAVLTRPRRGAGRRAQGRRGISRGCGGRVRLAA